jgi:hypothetical protein
MSLTRIDEDSYVTPNPSASRAPAQPTGTVTFPVAALASDRSFSLAWLNAFETLLERGGKTANLMVVMDGSANERLAIRGVLNAYINNKSNTPDAIETVASTLFPQDLYHPSLGDEAAARLYDTYRHAYPLLRRYKANNRGTYFGRLVAWERHRDEPYNQLDRVVRGLQQAMLQHNPKSSAYELSVSPTEGWSDDLRLQFPSDTNPMGFPCLSHISLTLMHGQLHMSALYRNQFFIDRAYGNYLGLLRLLLFICQEVGCAPGEIACLATHADAQLSQRKGRQLLADCRAALESSGVDEP